MRALAWLTPFLLAILTLPGIALGQAAWPNRPVSLVVPYPPGGSTDNVARPLVQEWSRVLGQAVVIENRGGAGGTIGADQVVRARPDGHSILLFPTAIFTISPHMMQLPYDVDRGFIPLARVAASDAFVIIHPSVPARHIRDLVALAKQRPGELRFGSAGNGTITQLQCEIFAEAAGIKLEHVPYRGSGQSFIDLLAGRIQMICDPAALPGVRDGRLIALASFGDRRHDEFKDVPTLMEMGLADRGAMSWFGIAVPAGTPTDIQARITSSLEEALRAPSVASGMAIGGLRPAFETGEAFITRIREDRAVFGGVVQRTGAKVN
jgi:tripartite-type tricarboxylate transporter receptor subunit TctC